MFADDIMLFKSVPSEEGFTELQRDIDRLNAGVVGCHVKVQPTKCKALVVSYSSREIEAPVLTVCGEEIERVSEWKYIPWCIGRPEVVFCASVSAGCCEVEAHYWCHVPPLSKSSAHLCSV